MIKLVAFDWNGTLLSDTITTLNSSNKIFKLYGIKPISLKAFRETFAIPITDFYKHWTKKEIDFIELSKKYHTIYEKAALKTRTRAGTKEVLKFSGKKHITRTIYSNHITPEITKQLMRLNIYEYFDEILARPAGDHSTVYNRSKDQKLFDYVKQKKLKPKEVLTIGDTEEEIEIGKKFGYYTVALTGGWNTEKRLKKHKPDFLIHNMKDLIKVIKKLNENLP
jgi:phosphoglycolate phosphatase-like HAD superfamily hydrolase